MGFRFITLNYGQNVLHFIVVTYLVIMMQTIYLENNGSIQLVELN